MRKFWAAFLLLWTAEAHAAEENRVGFVGNPLFCPMFAKAAERIETLVPEIPAGKTFPLKDTAARLPLEWKRLYFVEKKLPLGEIVDKVARADYGALFAKGREPKNIAAEPGLVVTESRWAKIDAKCPDTLLTDRKAGGGDAPNLLAPFRFELYRADLAGSGKTKAVALATYRDLTPPYAGDYAYLLDLEACPSTTEHVEPIPKGAQASLARYASRIYMLISDPHSKTLRVLGRLAKPHSPTQVYAEECAFRAAGGLGALARPGTVLVGQER